MPCVSLMHRKIYRETVVPRIKMRRLCRATEKATTKSANKTTEQVTREQALAAKNAAKATKKAAKARAAATKAALKTVKKLSRQNAKIAKKSARSAKIVNHIPDNQPSPAKTASAPQSVTLSALHADLAAITEGASSQPAPLRPRVSYISSTMQDFQEGVEVRILHTKHRLSVDNPLAPIAVLTAPLTSFRSDIALEAASSRSSETIRSATSEGEVARTRDGGLREHRVSEGQEMQPSGLFRRRPTRAELINAESSLGRTLFGPIPEGHRREFFHDRENVWIWHEDWVEANQESHQITVRYEVRPTGVYKKLGAGKYATLEGDELENFRRAAHAYLHIIKRNLYHLA